ncbi:hypothetical protein M8998_03795 [Sphingobacterium sp. lm-10]|uniref:hypothetical protein n=1 Tax=Sphingobacterium sp. lm-10 TaxID=2944904 RepID=UPI00202033ED|nr:hypothetical protein [Sphingobacterium sp. lm-10]MCL7987061.1 hypothetical protein [Sphingobacterium sp. lm-10]
MTEYYRVELERADGDERHTDVWRPGPHNYPHEHIHLLMTYEDVMRRLDHLPLDFLLILNNFVYLHGHRFMDELASAISFGSSLDLDRITHAPHHKGLTIDVDDLNAFLQSFDAENRFVMINDDRIFWEYFLEQARVDAFYHKTSRRIGASFFTDEASCTYFMNKYLSGKGHIHRVEILEQEGMFVGDFRIVDSLNHKMLYRDFMGYLRRYWSGEKTEEPMMEVIFQGEYRLVAV